jgi:hypothetical protein
MIGPPADRAHVPLRAGAYGRLGGACDAAESVPAQLERVTGHTWLARPATRGNVKDTAVRWDGEMAILPQRVNFDWLT